MISSILTINLHSYFLSFLAVKVVSRQCFA